VKRVLVRLLYFTFSLLLLLIGLQVLGKFLAHAVPAGFRHPVAFAVQIVICAAMLAVYRLEVRLFEHRNPDEAAFAGRGRWALYGIVGGAALFAAVIVILAAAGWASFGGIDQPGAALWGVGPAAAAAVGEEIVFRGAVFRILEEGWGTLAALIGSALLFGVMHGANPGATAVSTAAIALEGGVLLALAYVAARNLWFPIGVHFGWNYTEGSIFSAAVSGTRSHGALSIPLHGPEIMTGGDFGPEASVISVAVCLAAAVMLGLAARRLGHWRRRERRV
jgi:uncharacterized protein